MGSVSKFVSDAQSTTADVGYTRDTTPGSVVSLRYTSQGKLSVVDFLYRARREMGKGRVGKGGGVSVRQLRFTQ